MRPPPGPDSSGSPGSAGRGKRHAGDSSPASDRAQTRANLAGQRCAGAASASPPIPIPIPISPRRQRLPRGPEAQQQRRFAPAANGQQQFLPTGPSPPEASFGVSLCCPRRRQLSPAGLSGSPLSATRGGRKKAMRAGGLCSPASPPRSDVASYLWAQQARQRAAKAETNPLSLRA